MVPAMGAATVMGPKRRQNTVDYWSFWSDYHRAAGPSALHLTFLMNKPQCARYGWKQLFGPKTPRLVPSMAF